MRRNIFLYFFCAFLFIPHLSGFAAVAVKSSMDSAANNESLVTIITSKAYVDYVASTKVNNEDLAAKIAEAITAKENIDNKVQNLENADAIKYPSALAVKTALETKVDTTADANQTLNGTYTVAGKLFVPTPALPE